MSRTLDFIDMEGRKVVSVPFAAEIKFDGHTASLPQSRSAQTEELLHQGISLMNQNQADIQIDGKTVVYLFQ